MDQKNLNAQNEKNKKNKAGIIIAIIALLIIIAVAGIVFFATRNKSYRSITLKEYEGTVEVTRDNQALEIFQDLWFKSGDSASTGDESWMALEIDLDKHLMVNPNTVFDIVATGNEKKGGITIDLQQGKALVKIDNKLNDDSTFEITTPNAAMSVRGTTFSTSYDPSENESHIFVETGCVRVETLDGQSIELNAEEAATVKDESIITEDVYILSVARHYDWSSSDYINNPLGIRVESAVETPDSDETYYTFISGIPAAVEPIITSHYADMDAAYEEREENLEVLYTDVTDWFPEYVTMDIGYGAKTYLLEKALHVGNWSKLEDVSLDENIYLPQADDGAYFIGTSIKLYLTEADADVTSEADEGSSDEPEEEYEISDEDLHTAVTDVYQFKELCDRALLPWAKQNGWDIWAEEGDQFYVYIQKPDVVTFRVQNTIWSDTSPVVWRRFLPGENDANSDVTSGHLEELNDIVGNMRYYNDL